MRAVVLLLVAVLLATGFFTAMRTAGLPYHDGVAPPGAPARAHVPLRELAAASEEAWTDGDPGALWAARMWYPFALAPLWALALLLGGAPGRGWRRQMAGLLLGVVTAALVVLEGAYLATDYEAFLPAPFGDAEAVVAFVLVLFVLLARRPADRHLAAVEGHVAAQALLSFLHLITLPGTFIRRWWWGGADTPTVLARLRDGFPLPFSIATLALLAMVVVVLLRVTRSSQLRPG